MFKPVSNKHESVYEKVVKQLRNSILEGKLKPGDKLPGERNLAEYLGVSRSSLREALKRLSVEGLVNIKHGQGVFISERDPEQIILQFAQGLFAGNDTLKDLFEIRKIFEVQAAKWAAERVNKDQILLLENDVIKTLIMLKEEKHRNLINIAEHDCNFHNNLAILSGNAVLEKIMFNLIDLINESRMQTFSIPKRLYTSIEEHLEIVRAIEKKDPLLAGEAMLKHLENVERDLLGNRQ